MNKKIVLTIELVDNDYSDSVIEIINAEILCSLEEDYKFITGWEWIY